MRFNILLPRWVFPLCLLSLINTNALRADEHEQETPLAESMEQTSDAIKSLRKIDLDDWEAGAKAARAAADGIRKGMEFVPVLVKGMEDGKEKTRQIADYRRLMGLSYALLCELELAFLDQDSDKVDEVLKKVKANKKEGHEKYSDD